MHQDVDDAIHPEVHRWGLYPLPYPDLRIRAHNEHLPLAPKEDLEAPLFASTPGGIWYLLMGPMVLQPGLLMNCVPKCSGSRVHPIRRRCNLSHMGDGHLSK